MKCFFNLCLTLILVFAMSIAKSETDPVNGFNEFAFDLYHKISQADENIVVSPYSLSSLLSILANGAAQNTQLELLKLLHSPDINTMNAGVDIIDNSLKENSHCGIVCCQFPRLCRWLGLEKHSQTLVYANALWADQSVTYKKSFLEILHESRSAHFFTLNFKEDPEQSRSAINQWVADNTNNYIQDLIPEGAVNLYTRLVLTNAIYFKGLWQSPFERSATVSKPFTLWHGNKTQVPMMQNQKKFDYTENDILQMLVLPYANSTLEMIIILPKENHNLQEIKSSLNAETFAQLLKITGEREVTVSLPRFKFASMFNSLKRPIKALGLTDAFTDKANFSNLTNDRLFISEIIQKALIEVDEEGTVAAAATSITFAGTAYIPAVIFNADHAFLFTIMDKRSKIILFMGQVVDPREK